MTTDEFIKVVGYEPQLDDLERANCPERGQGAHKGCGVCKEHGLPVFICFPCFVAVNRGIDIEYQND